VRDNFHVVDILLRSRYVSEANGGKFGRRVVGCRVPGFCARPPMAPVRLAAAAPTIAPAVFFRSDLRVSAVLSAEDSRRCDWTRRTSLRSLGMRHLNHSVYLQEHFTRRSIRQRPKYFTQIIPAWRA